MTKQEAIANHRKMWRWIADETERRKITVGKVMSFDAMKVAPKDCPYANCFCCQYAIEIQGRFSRCTVCPVIWNTARGRDCNSCCGEGSVFMAWRNAINTGNWAEAAALAREIAELPEREDVR